MPIYTYYSGFVCVGIDKKTGKPCEKFVGGDAYTTAVRLGLRELQAESGIRVQCSHCHLVHNYHPSAIVYSLRQDEMVPLDREQS